MQTVNSVTVESKPSLTSEPFLVIENLTKAYPTAGSEDYVVLDGIDLTVNEGEFVCVIGHSGCGKSTLLDMVSGFRQPTSGQVRLQNKRITEPGPDRMVVFQNYSLLPWMTAFENIYLGIHSVWPDKPKAEKEQIVHDHLALVGLTEAAHKKPGQLSGGMKQRVCIARALALRPRYWCWMNPLAHLTLSRAKNCRKNC